MERNMNGRPLSPRSISDEVYDFAGEVSRDIIVLIHGNINSQAWAIAAQFIRHVLNHVNFARSQVAMVQYDSGKAKTEHEFSADRASLETRTNLMSPMNSWGKSELVLGLERCTDLFTTRNSNAGRVILLLLQEVTGKDASAAALRLRDSLHVKIVGVHIGSNEANGLERVATLNHVYNIRTMQALRDLLSNVSTRAFRKPAARVVLRFRNALELEISCPEEISEYKVELFDQAANTPDKYRLIQTIPVPNSAAATVTARIGGLNQCQNVSLRVSGVLKNNQRPTEGVIVSDHTLDERRDPEVLHRPVELREKIAEMVRDIRAWVPDPYLADRIALNMAKVALLGRVGEGKSSLINTLYSALSGVYRPVAMAIGNMFTGTSKLSEYPLDYTWVILMDSYGWEDDNLSVQEQQLICNGILADGYEEGGDIMGDMAVNADINRAVHSVIIVCDIDAVTNGAYMNRLKDFEWNWKAKFGRSVIVALTKCDRADPYLAKHPEYIYNSDIVEKRIATLSMATGIDVGDIYPCINRTGIEAVNPAVCEYLALKLLHASLFHCVAGLLANEKRKLRLQDLRAQVNVVEPENVPVEPVELLVAMPDGSFTELTLHERTYEELKQELVRIRELGLASVDHIVKVFTYRDIDGERIEVTLNYNSVRRLVNNQRIYVRVQ